jgi:hypothetical protein
MFRAARGIAFAALGLCAGPALAADLAPPPPLAPNVSGYLDSYVGLGFFDGSGDSVDVDSELSLLFGNYGAISIPLGSNLSIQQDVFYEYGTQASSSDESEKEDMFLYSGQIGTHLSLRDVSQGLIGGFGGFGLANGDSSSANYIFAGGEAMAYLGEWTLYAQGGWFDSESNDFRYDLGLNDAWFVRGVARWFLSPDARLQGEFAWASGDYGFFEDSADVLEWGVRYDWVWSDVPVVGSLVGAMPLFVAYRGNYAQGNFDDSEVWANTFMVGTSYRFGGNNLQEFDRVGAPLDLPNIGRWVASGTILDGDK